MKTEIFINLSEQEMKDLIKSSINDVLSKFYKESQNTLDNNEEYCSISEACKHLKCSKSTVHKLINQGEIKRAKIGRKSLIRYQSIIDYLKGQEESDIEL